jgi:hypothetical protein
MGVALFPAVTVCRESAATACVEALEQIAALNIRTPVYKLTGGDADSPAEVALTEKPTAHDSPNSIAAQRHRITKRCSVLETPLNVWLVQVWTRR